MKLFEFLSMCEHPHELIAFLQQCGVINTEMRCPRCSNNLALNISTLMFRCRKKRRIQHGHKKQKTIQCNFKQSVKCNTWLSNANLDLITVARFVAYFLMIRPPRYTFYEQELELPHNTIADWLSFCREVRYFIH